MTFSHLLIINVTYKEANMSLFKRFVYIVTKKPTENKRIRIPKSLQDHRQIQFYVWSKAHEVYSGSYLPINLEKLTAEGKKGWYENTKDKSGLHRRFIRKSTWQTVRYDFQSLKNNKYPVDAHYHWYSEVSQPETKISYNRYGEVCENSSPESHLAPLDEDFVYIGKKGKKIIIK